MTTEAMHVHIGTNCLTRDLVWCPCGRGLSLTGKWTYCPQCGKVIDQQSYSEAVQQAEYNGAFAHRMVNEEERTRIIDCLARIRLAIVGTLGGMGSGSSQWGHTQWDKGYIAGIQVALTAFDGETSK